MTPLLHKLIPEEIILRIFSFVPPLSRPTAVEKAGRIFALDVHTRGQNRAVDNWIKIFMHSTNSGLQRIKQATNTGSQSDLMDSTRWGWRCMVPTSRNGQLEKTGYHNMGGRVSA